MMTGPAVGPAMLLTVLMRWPSLIVIGSVSVGGTLIYRELDDRYDLTHQIQAMYQAPTQPQKPPGFPINHGDTKLPAPLKQPQASGGIMSAAHAKVPPSIAAASPQVLMNEKVVETPPLVMEAAPEQPAATAATALNLPEGASKPVIKRYTVARGDSLSRIVEKLGVPPSTRRDYIFELFMANLNAFQNNDPDRLNEGSILNIPNVASK